MSEILEDKIKETINCLGSSIEKGFAENFEKDFPKAVKTIELYTKVSKNKPFALCEALDYVRTAFKSGCKQYFPKLLEAKEKTNNRDILMVINGIFSGDFLKALQIKCRGYTDMVSKFFTAVYMYITEQRYVEVYKEYTLEEIVEYYNSSKWIHERKTLEETVKEYVGNPKMSLKDFKSPQDIIKWYATCKTLENKLYSANFDNIKEIIKNENN